MKINLIPQVFLALSLSIVNAAWAVSVPAIFSDHMVLQQKAEVTVWGSAKAGNQ